MKRLAVFAFGALMHMAVAASAQEDLAERLGSDDPAVRAQTLKRLWAEVDRQPALRLIRTITAWEQHVIEGEEKAGRGAIIAILDDGVDATHPEFRGRVLTNTPVTGSHGSLVAGVAAAGLDAKGMVGVAPYARIVAARPESTAELNALDAFAKDGQRIDVFAMPFGTTCKGSADKTLADFKALFTKHSDAVFVASAGSKDAGPIHGYPAAWATQDWTDGRLIVVGALDLDIAGNLTLGSHPCELGEEKLKGACLFAPGDHTVIGAFGKRFKQENDAALVANQSSAQDAQTADATGPARPTPKNPPLCLKAQDPADPAKMIEVVNPALASQSDPYDAQDILTIGQAPDAYYLAPIEGTSAAVGFVAGAVAALRGLDPDMTAATVIKILLESARLDFQPSGGTLTQPDTVYGYGLLDLNAAMTQVVAQRAPKEPQ